MIMMIQAGTSYVLCVENEGYETSLEKRKVYLCVADSSVTDEALVRVIDESGDSYLYPSDYFVALTLPETAAAAFEEINA